MARPTLIAVGGEKLESRGGENSARLVVPKAGLIGQQRLAGCKAAESKLRSLYVCTHVQGSRLQFPAIFRA